MTQSPRFDNSHLPLSPSAPECIVSSAMIGKIEKIRATPCRLQQPQSQSYMMLEVFAVFWRKYSDLLLNKKGAIPPLMNLTQDYSKITQSMHFILVVQVV